MFTQQQMQVLESLGAEMLRDGVTPEMFMQDPDAFTKAYMDSQTKKVTAMTNKYFTNSGFRHDCLDAIAGICVNA